MIDGRPCQHLEGVELQHGRRERPHVIEDNHPTGVTVTLKEVIGVSGEDVD